MANDVHTIRVTDQSVIKVRGAGDSTYSTVCTPDDPERVDELFQEACQQHPKAEVEDLRK